MSAIIWTGANKQNDYPQGEQLLELSKNDTVKFLSAEQSASGKSEMGRVAECPIAALRSM